MSWLYARKNCRNSPSFQAYHLCRKNQTWMHCVCKYTHSIRLKLNRFGCFLINNIICIDDYSNSDFKSGLECIRSYTTTCMDPEQRQHFNLLYHGTGELIHELCEESGYQKGMILIGPFWNIFFKLHNVCVI